MKRIREDYRKNLRFDGFTAAELRAYCDAQSIGYSMDWDAANIIYHIELTEVGRRLESFSKRWALPSHTDGLDGNIIKLSDGSLGTIPVADKVEKSQLKGIDITLERINPYA